jgi:hypothetical protein
VVAIEAGFPRTEAFHRTNHPGGKSNHTYAPRQLLVTGLAMNTQIRIVSVDLSAFSIPMTTKTVHIVIHQMQED